MRNLLLSLVIIAFCLTARGQNCAIVTIENQMKLQGDTIQFDVFIATHSNATDDLYLGFSQFVIEFDENMFNSNASLQIVPGSCTLVSATSSPVCFIYDLFSGYSKIRDFSNLLFSLDLNGPTPTNTSQYNSQVARIDAQLLTHRFGTFLITGYNGNDACDAGIKIVTALDSLTFETKLHTIDEVTFNTSLYPLCPLTPVPCSVLPIELVSFDVLPVEDKHAMVSWRTANEVDFTGFEVQRSLDGETFHQLSWEAANGGVFTTDYQFLDEDIRHNQTYYYRLKMVDLDGSFEYSDTKTLRIKKGKGVSAYYNSLQGAVILDHLPSKSELLIVDAVGRVAHSSTMTEKQATISVRDWAAGVYFLRVEDESFRFVVVR